MYTGTLPWQLTDKNPWGTHYNYDNADFQKTMGWMRGLIDKGYMPSLEAITGQSSWRHLRRRQVRDRHQRRLDDQTRCIGYKGVDTGLAPDARRSERQACQHVQRSRGLDLGRARRTSPAAAKWVEFLGSADCQDIVAAKARRLPGRQDLDRQGHRRVQGQRRRRQAFLSTSRTSTTFLFPITDHASEIERHHDAGNGLGLHWQGRAVVADGCEQPGERPLRIGITASTSTRGGVKRPSGPARRRFGSRRGAPVTHWKDHRARQRLRLPAHRGGVGPGRPHLADACRWSRYWGL